MSKKTLDEQIIARWNRVMYDVCWEHATINTNYEEFWLGETDVHITALINEAEYLLSCYYESGHCRCDDRFMGEYEYKVWASEVAKLKRLIAYLRSIGNHTIFINRGI